MLDNNTTHALQLYNIIIIAENHVFTANLSDPMINIDRVEVSVKYICCILCRRMRGDMAQHGAVPWGAAPDRSQTASD